MLWSSSPATNTDGPSAAAETSVGRFTSTGSSDISSNADGDGEEEGKAERAEGPKAKAWSSAYCAALVS